MSHIESFVYELSTSWVSFWGACQFVGPRARKPSAGEGIQSRRQLACSFPSLSFSYFLFFLPAAPTVVCIHNNNNNNNNTIMSYAILNTRTACKIPLFRTGVLYSGGSSIGHKGHVPPLFSAESHCAWSYARACGVNGVYSMRSVPPLLLTSGSATVIRVY